MTEDDEIDDFFKRLNIQITWNKLRQFIQEDSHKKIKETLLSAARLSQRMKLDPRILISWEEIFTEDSSVIRQHFPQPSLISRLSSASNRGMSITYVIFSGLAFSVAMLPLLYGHMSPDFALAMGNLGVGQTWNHLDTMGGYIVACDQWLRGQYVEASLNCMSSSQQLGCTLAGVLGEFVFHTVSSIAATSLLGFSFAASLFIAASIEHYSMTQAESRIKTMRELVDQEESIPLKISYEQLILIEQANSRDHARNRNIWIICGLTVLIVSFIALNIATFGAPIIAVALVAAIAFAASMIRFFFLDDTPHMKNIQSIKGDTLQKWFELLEKANETPNSEFARSIFSAKDHITSLCTENPKQAKIAIEQLYSQRLKFNPESPTATETLVVHSKMKL